MRSVTVRLDDLKNIILNLGFVGENEHRQFRFDSMKMFGEYPNASVSMTVCPPEGDAYPATIERDGDFVIWTITDSDLVAEGDGEIQITFTESPHIAKTYIGRTKTSRSLVPTGEIPSGLDDFITRADALLDQVEEAFPTGGTTGQVLAKKSNDDFDTEWVDQGGGGGTSDYEELDNLPQIGGVTLKGNKTLHELGAAAESDIPDVSGFYTKPADGIPASDMASGVIPVLTDLIDDTAGEGDTNKVWSADKSSSLLTEIQSSEERIQGIGEAIISVLQHVAFSDDDGANAYDDLYELIYGAKTLVSISAVYTQSGTVYDTDSLDSLKTDLVVTATYDDSSSETVSAYTLSGTLSAGTSTITVSYGGKTTTFTVTVTASSPTLVSISATFDSSAVVYDTDSLDSLKDNLTVMATYSDSQTPVEITTGYTLSGTIAAGTSTITVTYEGKTDTFSVLVHDITYVTGYTMSVNTEPIGLNSNTSRAVFLDAYGDYPIIYKASGEDSPYYPMPIPKGATRLLFTYTGGSGRQSVPIIFKYDSNNKLVRQDNNDWNLRTYLDLSSYNDGTYFITVGVNTASGSGDVAIEFSFE